MLDWWMDVELVRREHDAAQCAADVRADDAKHCGRDPTHGLSARHDSSRDQTDDKTEDDQPDDVQDHDDSPLMRMMAGAPRRRGWRQFRIPRQRNSKPEADGGELIPRGLRAG